MSWGDVRGLLQYVPQFRGQVFVVIVDAPVPALAEVMLDLVTLQNIGVHLVIGSTVHTTDTLLDRAAEVELKYSQKVLEIEHEPSEVLTTINRGQTVFFNLHGSDPLAPDWVAFAHALDAQKIILLGSAQMEAPTGAARAAEVAEDKSSLMYAAALACKAGIPRVHLLDGSDPGVLLGELFSNEGVGAMIYADSYRIIRPLREEDTVELLGMIGRSVRNAHLVPRDYAEVVSRMDDYFVMEIDGNVVGSVALYGYTDANTAEIACLYVKQSHEGLGYGVELVRHAEQQAEEGGISSVFALTNRASGFFRKLGYEEMAADGIPYQRYQQLISSGRDSGVFSKKIFP